MIEFSKQESANNNATAVKRSEKQLVEDEFNTPESQRCRELVAGDTFALVKSMMEQSGMIQAASLINDKLGKEQTTQKADEPVKQGEAIPSRSVTTIYDNAVRDETFLNREHPNRISSSSEEEVMYSSDEIEKLVTLPNNGGQLLPNNFNVFAGERETIFRRLALPDPMPTTLNGRNYTSGRDVGRLETNPGDRTEMAGLTSEQRSYQHIRDAEASKARILGTPGKQLCSPAHLDVDKRFVHSTMVNEDY